MRFAIKGIVAAFRTERSFRTQSLFGSGALGLLFWYRAGGEWVALFVLTIGGVLAAELFNTALENALDHLSPEKHPAMEVAKDCAAGAVFVLSLTSLAVLLAFLFSRG